MKNLLVLLFLTTVSQGLAAQACGNPQSSIDIHGNNIQARILNGGDLFTDFSSAQFFPNPDPNSASNPATIFAAGIWIGGVDPGGNLKLATVDYRSNNHHDFSAGPLNPDGTTDAFTCANWDRHFRVTGEEIANFIAAQPLTAAALKAQFPSIAGWPATGNAFFSDIWGFDLPSSDQSLASFIETNSNGLYEPLLGEYPAVSLRGFQFFVPAEIVWCVFNDQNAGGAHTSSNGKPLQVEIQLTAWAFNCGDQPVLNNTLFTSHKIINRASEDMDSTYLGLWVDADLGCPADDYVGCNPGLHTMYAYNQDAVDGQPGMSCQDAATFPGQAPVQSITILNHPLSKFIVSNNPSVGNPPAATTDPSTPAEIYNYMTGSWRDGTPFTYGGSGYNPGSTNVTDHVFPDDPALLNGWSMCSSNLAFGDRRMLGTAQLGTLEPGKVEELNTAWAFHPNPALPCGLGTTFSDVTAIQNVYNNGFSGICSPLKAPELPAGNINLFPNPTADAALLRYGALIPNTLRAFDGAGRMVWEKTGKFEKESTLIETTDFASGVYTLQIVTEQGIATKKLVVIR